MNMKKLTVAVTLGMMLSSLQFGTTYAEEKSEADESTISAISAELAIAPYAIPEGSTGTSTGVAIGTESHGNADFSVAIGYYSQAGKDNTEKENIAIGYNAIAHKDYSFALGSQSYADGIYANAIGYYSQADGESAIALGDNTLAEGKYATAIGSYSEATAEGAIALGENTTATIANSIALGSKSSTAAAKTVGDWTVGDVTYTVAGKTASGVVSFGNSSFLRQLQYVAAGSISKDSTDAVNGSQLYAAYQAINANHDSIEALKKNGTGSGGSSIETGTMGKDTSLAIGINSRGNADCGIAIGVQAKAGNNNTELENVAIGYKALAKNNYSMAFGSNAWAQGTYANAIGYYTEATAENAIALGNTAKAKNKNATAIGSKASVTADDGLAIGTNAKVTSANSVALGANSSTAVAKTVEDWMVGDVTYTVAGKTASGVVSFGNSSFLRQLQYVAAGSISKDSTDAVNGSQLYAAYQAIRANYDSIEALKKNGTGSGESGTITPGNYITQEALDSAIDAAKSTLQSDIKAEQTARQEADGKLQEKINQLENSTGGTGASSEEIGKLQGQIDTNKNAITTEESARVAGDKALQDQINKQTESIEGFDTRIGANEEGIKTNKENIAANSKRIDGIESNVLNNTKRIDSLGSRMDKVGAGAAALAALHPLDYDSDNKLSVASGLGNYAGSNAWAVGAFYRPNENCMVSLGGTMGNGENMVNLGVSFAIGKGKSPYASVSKQALVHEVQIVKGENAQLKEKVDQQDKKIAELALLVKALLEKEQ